MKCTVKFQRSPHGTAAVLMHRGASLNTMNYPRGHKVTLKEARRAKRSLLAQCDELAKDHQRHVRRAKRQGVAGFALKDLWPFGKKKPAKRHPMSRTVYVMKTRSGTYKPVDRPPNAAMAGARSRSRKRRR